MSPIAGFLTYLAIYFFTGGTEGSHSDYAAVSICLLITAGTFLYIATIYVLPEVYCSAAVHKPSTHPHFPEEHVHDKDHYSKLVELFFVLCGFLTPLAITLFTPHEK